MFNLTLPRTRTAKLSLTWLFLSFLFASSGIVLIVTAQIWSIQRQQGMGKHTLRSLVISGRDLAVVATVDIASVMWFFTLTERADFRKMWLEQDGTMQVFLQDRLHCCGYWNASTPGLLTQTTGFCAPFSQAGINATSVQGCVGPIVNFADFFLNNVFTTIYGFTAVQLSLFLITCCLIISRRDDERVRFVWAKMEAGVGVFGR
ncbi:hypothetical protein JCM11641_005163 [Rhodosporidiobolus odoratus]